MPSSAASLSVPSKPLAPPISPPKTGSAAASSSAMPAFTLSTSSASSTSATSTPASAASSSSAAPTSAGATASRPPPQRTLMFASGGDRGAPALPTASSLNAGAISAAAAASQLNWNSPLLGRTAAAPSSAVTASATAFSSSHISGAIHSSMTTNGAAPNLPHIQMRANGVGVDAYSPRVGAKAAASVTATPIDTASAMMRGSGAVVVAPVPMSSSGIARTAKPSVFDLRGV